MSIRERLDGLAADFDAAPLRWRRLAIAIAIAIAAICSLGILYDLVGGPKVFLLRGEVREGGFYIPVLFSWAILLTAGIAAAVQAKWALSNVERWAWLGVALLFAMMAFDELLMIHERAEFETGVDFQLIYLPIVAAGGIAWLVLAARMPRWSLELTMWVTGAVFWFLSQVLENLEYTSDDVAVSAFKALDDAEKVLQFSGSALFMLVALLGVERAINRPRPGAP